MKQEDRPELPANSLPYPLTVTLHKRFLLRRGDDEPVELELDDGAVTVEVHDGDYLQERSKGYWFQCVLFGFPLCLRCTDLPRSRRRFKWVPTNLCFSNASSADKKKHREAAKALGQSVPLDQP